MAYMSQELKKSLSPKIKAVLQKYNIKGSIAVRHHSTLVVTLKQGEIDFIENLIATDANKSSANKMSADHIAYIRKEQSLSINPYWYQEHYSGKAVEFLKELFVAMKDDTWYDNTDAQIDYFDTAYYVDVNVGKWNAPYAFVK
jgi:hypothetical protein